MQFQAEVFITKRDIISRYQLSPEAAQGRIKRALKNSSIILLRRGLYLNANVYLHESNRTGLIEFIASKLHPDSYVSLEYALQKYQMLPSPIHPQPPQSITLITLKQTANYQNITGNFTYKNIKPSCYFGFQKMKFHDQTYYIATKAKALFDYLYLKAEFGPRNEKYLYNMLFHKSKFQWKNFSEEDFKQFDSYVWKSNSFKMMRLLRAIELYFENKKFETWKKELLSN